jgi:hypothetical protein
LQHKAPHIATTETTASRQLSPAHIKSEPQQQQQPPVKAEVKEEPPYPVDDPLYKAMYAAATAPGRKHGRAASYRQQPHPPAACYGMQGCVPASLGAGVNPPCLPGFWHQDCSRDCFWCSIRAAGFILILSAHPQAQVGGGKTSSHPHTQQGRTGQVAGRQYLGGMVAAGTG